MEYYLSAEFFIRVVENGFNIFFLLSRMIAVSISWDKNKSISASLLAGSLGWVYLLVIWMQKK